MTDVEHPQQITAQGQPAGTGAAQYPVEPLSGTVVTAEPSGLDRFVPDANELVSRLERIAAKPVRTRKRPAVAEESAGPSSFVPAVVRENLSLKGVLLVLLGAGLLVILLVLLWTGNLDFRGPQETSQSAPTTEAVATTPAEEAIPATSLPFLEAVASGQLTAQSRAPYPAVTSKDAMTALISAVAFENQPLMASLLHPEARLPDVTQIVETMSSPAANLSVASQTVTCAESAETATCNAQATGLTREVQFIKVADVWQLAGWV